MTGYYIVKTYLSSMERQEFLNNIERELLGELLWDREWNTPEEFIINAFDWDSDINALEPSQSYEYWAGLHDRVRDVHLFFRYDEMYKEPIVPCKIIRSHSCL